jgi:hypothetical protein
VPFKEFFMRHLFSLFLIFCLYGTFLFAVSVPQAHKNPAANLEHYLEYLSEEHIDFSCAETKSMFACESDRQTFETTENNVTTAVAFQSARLRFNASAAVVLEKARFDAAMKEINATQQLRKKYLASKQPYLAPPSSPLQDALDRTLYGNLEQVDVEGLDINTSEPKSHVSVKSIAYINAMKRTADKAAFSERIFGTLQLKYTEAKVETDDPASLYGEMPQLLESWFETNNTRRAEYVGTRLGELYANEMKHPFSGSLLLSTKYLGGDAMQVRLEADNHNGAGSRDTFDFQGELRGISTLFAPARRPQTPGTPDFLFQSLHAENSTNAKAYRALLAHDKTFNTYMNEYVALINSAFAKRLKKFAYSPVISEWLLEAKKAVTSRMLGRADTFTLDVTNRNGMTAMQVFGMLMGQLMLAPQTPQQQLPDNEKIILDTAATHLDIKIKTK